MAPKKSTPPSVLLVGVGYFGRNHLQVLLTLEKKKLIVLKGAVVRDEKKGKALEKEFGIITYGTLTPALLKSVDAVDIVTPPETHFALIKKCLPYTNVFVEKPITTKSKDALVLEKLAKKYKRTLAVGHIFRYNNVTEKLKILLDKKGSPKKIHGVFTNPLSTDKGREPSLEMMHLFDIVHYIFNKDAALVSGRKHDRITHTHVRYAKLCDAHYDLGWVGDVRTRTLTFKYENETVEVNYMTDVITVKKGPNLKVHTVKADENLILTELKDFISTLSTKKDTKATGEIGRKMVEIGEQAIPKTNKKPRVAIIGGGVFGTSAAAELSEFCEVTIFEKNKDIMEEGAYVNCFRHHAGYHYPRSSETVVEIQNTKKDFESVYEKAIIRSYPTYYGIARHGSHFSAKDFLAFCEKHNLSYAKSGLSSHLLTKSEMELCIQVDEPGYHYETLKKIVKARLAKKKSISLICDATVQKLVLNKDNTKSVLYIKNKKKVEKKFDFVINATYANLNLATTSALFEKSPIRIDLTEVLVIKLPIDPVSITVIDGPFATLIPTGNKHEFTLYHVTESILDRYVPADGLIKKRKVIVSNQEAIVRESMKYFPILKEAVIVESRIVHRAVQANREHDDSRVVDLIDHGFGCWSVLSGKILTSVSTGKKIASIIKKTTE